MNDNTADIGQLIEPAPVAFSFDAPGWTVIAVALVVILLTVVVFLWRNHIRNRYRRDALRHVQALERDVQDHNTLVYEVNMILKRIALRFAARKEVASLRNQEWIEFLNGTSKPHLFSDAVATNLFRVYSGNVTSQHARDFIVTAKQWIKGHKPRALHRGSVKLKETH